MFSRGAMNQVVQGVFIGGSKKAGDGKPMYQPGLAQGLIKLEAIYDELVKQTQTDIMDTDAAEEQTRKLNERNFNTRVQTHIRDALGLAVLLQQRYSAPVTEPMPYSRALEFSTLLQKAYKGQIEPIGINPHLKEEAKEKKLYNQKTVA